MIKQDELRSSFFWLNLHRMRPLLRPLRFAFVTFPLMPPLLVLSNGCGLPRLLPTRWPPRHELTPADDPDDELYEEEEEEEELLDRNLWRWFIFSTGGGVEGAANRKPPPRTSTDFCSCNGSKKCDTSDDESSYSERLPGLLYTAPDTAWESLPRTPPL